MVIEWILYLDIFYYTYGFSYYRKKTNNDLYLLSYMCTFLNTFHSLSNDQLFAQHSFTSVVQPDYEYINLKKNNNNPTFEKTINPQIGLRNAVTGDYILPTRSQVIGFADLFT